MKALLKKNETRLFIFGFCILGLMAWTAFTKEAKPIADSGPTRDSLAGIDTLIPRGFVLVPIELINAEPLSSLIGSTAIVDLYLPSVDKLKSGRKLGSRIKLIRAPLNPQLFAVLVSDLESEKILAQPGPYFAVLKNHTETNSVVKSDEKTNIEISYQK